MALSCNTPPVSVADQQPQGTICSFLVQSTESTRVAVGTVGNYQEEVLIEQRVKGIFHPFYLLGGKTRPVRAAQQWHRLTRHSPAQGSPKASAAFILPVLE